MKLSVVVPCYNEAANVSEFESELSKALLKEKITYEIIFIDDGSTDDTYNKLSSLNKSNKNVKVIRLCILYFDIREILLYHLILILLQVLEDFLFPFHHQQCLVSN